MSTRVVTWDEYCRMSDGEKRHVDVINFTGLADDLALTSAGEDAKLKASLDAEGTIGVERAGEIT